MTDTEVQITEDDLKNAKQNETKQGEAQSVPETNKPGAKSNLNLSVSKTFKIGLGFVILSLCALLALTGLWIAEWQKHKKTSADLWSAEWQEHNKTTERQIADIRAEITDMRGLINESITEDIVSLKIHVLNRKVSNETAREIASVVNKYARLYEREPDLILAIMRVESNFDPKIESKMGAIGLMQVMPHWIDVLGIDCNLKNPDCNTKYGLQILGAYELLYGNLDMALTAFNRGPGPVDAALMRGKSPDNGYADKVKAVYKRLRELTR